MSKDVMESFASFADAVTKNQRKPNQKFISQALFGIVSGRSILLSNIGRSLDEPMSLTQTSKRISRNLNAKTLDDDALLDDYLDYIEPISKSSEVIAVDFSDISKPYSLTQEGLCAVWDGSKGETHPRGYHLLFVEGVTRGRVHAPLYGHAYSSAERGHKSAAAEVRKAVFKVKDRVPSHALWVADRGFDGRNFFAVFNDAGVQWAVRSKGNREIVDRDGRQHNIESFAWSSPKPYSSLHQSINPKGRGKKRTYRIDFGYARIKLMKDKRTYTLVYGRLFDVDRKKWMKRPLMIITNRMPRSKKDARSIIKGYFKRWSVEETARLIKQTFCLENIRVQALLRIKRLTTLAFMAFGYLCSLSKWGRGWMKRFVNRHYKTFGTKDPRFMFYRLAEAISAVFSTEEFPRRWASPGSILGAGLPLKRR